MSARVWIGIIGVLALTWLKAAMREYVIAWFGLYAALSAGCGLGAVALKAMRPGLVRRGGAILLFVLSWTAVVGWDYYLNRGLHGHFGWVGALGVILIPVGAAAWVSTLAVSATWTAIQVSTVALAAAPLSTFIALVLAMRIFGDSP